MNYRDLLVDQINAAVETNTLVVVQQVEQHEEFDVKVCNGPGLTNNLIYLKKIDDLSKECNEGDRITVIRGSLWQKMLQSQDLTNSMFGQNKYF